MDQRKTNLKFNWIIRKIAAEPYMSSTFAILNEVAHLSLCAISH